MVYYFVWNFLEDSSSNFKSTCQGKERQRQRRERVPLCLFTCPCRAFNYSLSTILYRNLLPDPIPSQVSRCHINFGLSCGSLRRLDNNLSLKLFAIISIRIKYHVAVETLRKNHWHTAVICCLFIASHFTTKYYLRLSSANNRGLFRKLLIKQQMLNAL